MRSECVYRRGVNSRKPAMDKAKRVVAYLRVSTGEQAESGLGLEAQLAACAAWAAAQGLTVAAVYSDEGVSGSKPIDKRPGLLGALGALGRGAVLVAAKRDRLARSVYVAAALEHMVGRLGATIETPDAPEAGDPFADAFRAMIDVFAQLERAQVALRTRAALGVKRARGEKLGGALPLGCGVADDGRTLVRDDAEAEAVELVRALRADGFSQREIVERLNAEGVPCRGEKWHRTTVRRLLARCG